MLTTLTASRQLTPSMTFWFPPLCHTHLLLPPQDRWLGQDPRSGGALSASRCPVTTAATAIRAAAGFATQADNGAAAAAANAVTRSGSGSSSGESAVAAAAATLVAAPPAGSMAGGGDGGGVSSGSESDGGSGGGTRRAGGGGGRAIRYMPFADGSRNCVGQHLAMLMLKVTTAYLASRCASAERDQQLRSESRLWIQMCDEGFLAACSVVVPSSQPHTPVLSRHMTRGSCPL